MALDTLSIPGSYSGNQDTYSTLVSLIPSFLRLSGTLLLLVLAGWLIVLWLTDY
jgi:hypothetical protein